MSSRGLSGLAWPGGSVGGVTVVAASSSDTARAEGSAGPCCGAGRYVGSRLNGEATPGMVPVSHETAAITVTLAAAMRAFMVPGPPLLTEGVLCRESWTSCSSSTGDGSSSGTSTFRSGSTPFSFV